MSSEQMQVPAADVIGFPEIPASPLKRCPLRLEVIVGGRRIADTDRGYRVRDGEQAPVYYIPPGDVDHTVLFPAWRSLYADGRGRAALYDIESGSETIRFGSWVFEKPSDALAPVAGYYAFPVDVLDECRIDGEIDGAEL